MKRVLLSMAAAICLLAGIAGPVSADNDRNYAGRPLHETSAGDNSPAEIKCQIVQRGRTDRRFVIPFGVFQNAASAGVRILDIGRRVPVE